MQFADFPFSFALARAGKSIPARMALIAMTTNNSIRVNAPRVTDRGRGIINGGYQIRAPKVKPRAVYHLNSRGNHHRCPAPQRNHPDHQRNHPAPPARHRQLHQNRLAPTPSRSPPQHSHQFSKPEGVCRNMKSVTPYGLPYFLLRRRKIAIHSVDCSFPNLLYVIRRLIIIKKTKKQDCILFSPLECFATAVKISSWRKRKRLCGVVRAASSAPRARAMKENQAYENIHAQSRYS